jgi:hypothetical protein
LRLWLVSIGRASSLFSFPKQIKPFPVVGLLPIGRNGLQLLCALEKKKYRVSALWFGWLLPDGNGLHWYQVGNAG